MRYGNPGDRTASWLMVPLIRHALRLDGPHPQYEALDILRRQGMPASVDDFHRWARAYRHDFIEREITPDQIPIQPDGYIPHDWQEALLFPPERLLENEPLGIDIPHTLLGDAICQQIEAVQSIVRGHYLDEQREVMHR